VRILVDLDGICADFFAELWKRLSAITGNEYSTDQVMNWSLGSNFKEPGRDMVKLIDSIYEAPGFFEALQPIPGARTAIQDLQTMGHEVLIVSAPCTPASGMEKLQWCKDWLPSIGKKEVVITGAKHIFKADVLIDDSPFNVVKFKAENPTALALSIAYNHNNVPEYDGRYGSFREPEAAWSGMVRHILGRK
jgi:5'(3')-deoxyribonucleotidase